MSRYELISKYFNWMKRLVSKHNYNKGLSYTRLLQQLHDTDFIYILDRDANRAEDGVDLRYRFGYELRLDKSVIDEYLNSKCSVLEMMIALAIRCDETIMDYPENDGNSGRLFWKMINNLGLIGMDDDHYDYLYIDNVLDDFLHMNYKPNGEGGLFIIDGYGDIRDSEIWYQMCWYVDDIMEREEVSYD